MILEMIINIVVYFFDPYTLPSSYEVLRSCEDGGPSYEVHTKIGSQKDKVGFH